jgi:hypothetical protein
MKEDNQIDKLFRDTLFDHEEQLPTYIWDRIQEDLDHSKRKKMLFYIRTLAAVVALLIAFGAGHFFTKYSDDKQLISETHPQEISIKPENSTTITTAIDDRNVANSENKPIETKYRKTHKNETLITSQTVDTDIIQLNLISSIDIKNISVNYQGEFDKELVEQLQSPILNLLPFQIENEEDKISSFTPKWSLGSSVSPLLASNSNKEETNIDASLQHAFMKESVNNNKSVNIEEALLTYSGGLNLEYQSTKRLTFKTGMYYEQKAQRIDKLAGMAILALIIYLTIMHVTVRLPNVS